MGEGIVDADPMPVADVAQEFVLTLHPTPDGGPCGTLRAVGHDEEKAFDGWIDLIGLITECRRTAMDHTATMRSTYERISAGDLDGFAALVAGDFVEHEEVPGLPPTKDGMLDYFRMLLAAFPDLRLDVEDLIAGGGKTVARVTATATHHDEFMGVPATGKRVEMGLIDIMRFKRRRAGLRALGSRRLAGAHAAARRDARMTFRRAGRRRIWTSARFDFRRKEGTCGRNSSGCG